MALTLPDAEQAPSSPEMILAFVRDNIATTGTDRLTLIESRLHDRLRILREREQPADLIREALALCAERRTELASNGEA